MFIIAQIMGILVLILHVLSMQFNDKKKIILMMVLINVFSAISFILLGSVSGPLICGFAVMQAIINRYFEKRTNRVPNGIVAIYIAISIIIGVVSFNTFVDVIPTICSIMYSITILQSKEKNIRILTLINMLLWIAFDLSYGAYTTVLSDFVTVISTLIGMYRFDFKKNKKN